MRQERRRNTRHGGGGPHRPLPVEAVEVEILRMGEQGDGIAETPRGRLYVPLTPGDRVRAVPLQPRGEGFAAQLLAVLAPAPAGRSRRVRTSVSAAAARFSIWQTRSMQPGRLAA